MIKARTCFLESFHVINKNLLKLYISFKMKYMKIPNKNKWEKAFFQYFIDLQYGYSAPKNRIISDKKKLLEGFASKSMKLVYKSRKKIQKSENKAPILICVVKDELDILPLFFSHYRKIGIKRFVMIDNMSTDGTLEYLKKQADTDVFMVNEEFGEFVKEGWINRILALYGYNRWYLVVDADELLVWPHMEEKSLEEMLKIFQRRKEYRPMAVMLDMYSKGFLYQSNIQDVYREFCYCDKNTYYWLDNQVVDILSGGPRERKLNCKAWLNKTPLFYFRPMDLFCCAHYMYPYKKLDDAKCLVALLHYKFAYENNFKKMRDYIRNGADSDRVEESIGYTKSRKISFYYEDSICLDDTGKLCEIECISDAIQHE